MQLPFFYFSGDESLQELTLDEDTSRHMVQVLRMKEGDRLQLTNGKGSIFISSIREAHKKHCIVKVEDHIAINAPSYRTIMGVSLIKNSSRFEWFLEKATEIGISEIVPLICSRTEKEKFRFDRFQNIITSAMVQSRQAWLPILHQPIAFQLLFAMEDVVNAPQKFIAHCMEGEKQPLAGLARKADGSSILLIGPEGDFDEDEVAFAIQNNFKAVSLGETRLRTETAGMVGAVLLRAIS